MHLVPWLHSVGLVLAVMQQITHSDIDLSEAQVEAQVKVRMMPSECTG